MLPAATSLQTPAVGGAMSASFWLLCRAQAEVVSSLMSQLPAVEVEDLPGLTKYLIGAAASSNAEQVCEGCQTCEA